MKVYFLYYFDLKDSTKPNEIFSMLEYFWFIKKINTFFQ